MTQGESRAGEKTSQADFVGALPLGLMAFAILVSLVVLIAALS